MKGRTRKLTLDICDYTNKVLCNLYDNNSDISGQATNVVVTHERNGWKTINFSIPSVCYGENDEEPNYRLNYLIADYRIRLVDDYETDWFLISENKINHNNFSKTVEVTAGHISQLLKTKNLNLEFSDDEGNNVGTAYQLLDAILKGSGWEPGEVADFKEEDGSTKVRSLTAPLKTGAFKMVSDMCDLFEAKAIYHGDTHKVDILPMNPFSKTPAGQIPDQVKEGLSDIIELHYDRNIHSLTRTTNTENMATKFYAYGAYGDANLGMCSIQTCQHKEYEFISEGYNNGDVVWFEDDDGINQYFKLTQDVPEGNKLIWSRKDFTSRSYLWDDTSGHAYHKCDAQLGTELPSPTVKLVDNLTPELFNFDYYDDVGLFTDEHLQEVAKYQREMPKYYKTSIENSTAFVNSLTELSDLAQSNTGFLKLSVSKASTTSGYESDDGHLRLVINNSVGDNGVVYRSDYREAKKNYFRWHVAKQIKDNGLPIPSSASILYILHNTEPVTFEKFYVKAIMDSEGNYYLNSEGEPGDFDYSLQDDEPTKITLWCSVDEVPTWSEDDKFYLFCTDSMSGRLGTAISTDDALPDKLSEAVKDDTIYHPILFGEEFPEVELANYGWFYKYYKHTIQDGELYFCWAERGDTEWHRLYVQEETPDEVDNEYFYDRKMKKFYHGEGGEWKLLESLEEQRVGARTNIVFHSCRSRDMAYHGYYEKYLYEIVNPLDQGNYAINSDYDFYWVFSTHADLPAGTTLTLDTIKGYVYVDSPSSNIVSTATTRTYDTITFPTENIIDFSKVNRGEIDDSGVATGGEAYITGHSIVYENTLYKYSFSSSTKLFFYTNTKTFINSEPVNGIGTITTPANARYVRAMSTEQFYDTDYIQVKDYQDKMFLSDKQYTKLYPITNDGELIGINNLVKKFGEISDRAYEQEYQAMVDAQQAIEEKTNNLNIFLGDMLREGFWSDDSYIEGDEDKLYADALDNFEKVAKPEVSYSFTFVDQYGSSFGFKKGHELDEEPDDDTKIEEIEYPDIEVTDAVHLIDPEIKINCWAYIDKLEKCYDKPWQTKIEVNTNLSLIGQHDFSDVMARIAEVSNETKNKQTLYERAAALSGSGKLSADKLEGSLETGKNKLVGGAANWYTDDKGRMVFESSDGKSSMMLSGDGWMLSDTKDAQGEPVFRTIATGQGISADAITAGTLSAKLIETGSITADKIDATVGEELEISSNKALVLFATTDGTRPAGALGDGDSMIEIRAGDAENPGKIDVKSGGEVNVQSGGNLNIESGGSMAIKAGGSLSISTEGILDVTAEATFKLDSPNLKVNLDGQGEVIISGNINTSGAMIAGFTLGQEVDEENPEIVKRDYMYAGTDSLSSTEPGVYLGTDGVNFGGDFIYRDDDESVHMDDGKTFLSDGAILKTKLENAQKSITGQKFTLDADTGNARVLGNETLNIDLPGEISVGSGNNLDIGSDASNTYIRNGVMSIDDTTHNGIYVGTNGINLGAGKFIINKDGTAKTDSILINGGIIDIKDDNNVTNFNVTSDGILTAHNVSVDGVLSSTEGSSIANMQIGETHIGNNTEITNSTFGFANREGIVFWAGGEYTDDLSTSAKPDFYVTRDGKLSALEINGKDYQVSIRPDNTNQNYSCDFIADISNQVINIIGSGQPLHFYGTVHSASSKDVKHNIKPLNDVGKTIDNLNPVSFVYNNDPNEETKFGLIYEEAIKVLPEICTKNDNNKAIDYTQLIPVLLKEIQSLRRRIEYLENKKGVI